MSNQSECPHEDVSVEFYASGIVPAEKKDGKWVPVDRLGPYIENVDYGPRTVCDECGREII